MNGMTWTYQSAFVSVTMSIMSPARKERSFGSYVHQFVAYIKK